MPETRTRGLQMIALFKLGKAAALLLVCATAWRMIQHDPTQTVIHWALRFQVDPENSYLQALLARLLHVSEQQLAVSAVGAFVYAVIFAVEGVGLWYARAWAEYLTSITTASLLPLELYELITKASLTKWGLLFLNLGIVIYLVRRVSRRGHSLVSGLPV
jgi:uncharacterized membrane protein (DUF2068 family)